MVRARARLLGVASERFGMGRNCSALVGIGPEEVGMFWSITSGPDVFTSDEFDGLVLTDLTGEDMVVLVSEDSEAEVVSVRDIDAVVMV